MPTSTRFACGSGLATLLSSMLLVSLVMRSTAFRSRASEEATHNMSAETHTRGWQKKTYLFCLGSEQEIQCNGEKEKMRISTAMYNRNQKLRKEVCSTAELGSKWRGCGVDAKEMVTYRCEGTQRCLLIPSDHENCAEDPFYHWASATVTTALGSLVQAHPPAAGGHPLPLFEQHQAFLATDQPAIQLANPALQSYGSAMGAEGAQPPPWFGQPLP